MIYVGRAYPTPVSLCGRGLSRPPSKGFRRINKQKEKIIYFYYLSLNYNNRLPTVGNDSHGIHCCWLAARIYELTKYIVKNNSHGHLATFMHDINLAAEKNAPNLLVILMTMWVRLWLSPKVTKAH